MYGTWMVHDCVVERAAAAAGQPPGQSSHPAAWVPGASSCYGTQGALLDGWMAGLAGGGRGPFYYAIMYHTCTIHVYILYMRVFP